VSASLSAQVADRSIHFLSISLHQLPNSVATCSFSAPLLSADLTLTFLLLVVCLQYAALFFEQLRISQGEYMFFESAALLPSYTYVTHCLPFICAPSLSFALVTAYPLHVET
jgi:hypothetical protein